MQARSRFFPTIFLQTKHISFTSSPTSLTVRLSSSSPENFIFLLLKHAANYKTTLRLHSHVITSGLLLYTSINYTLLFNTLLRFYPLFSNSLHQTTPSLPLNSIHTFAYSFLLHSCANQHQLNGGSILAGFQLHSLTLKLGFQPHVFVQTALLQFYGSSGLLDKAHYLFHEMPYRNSVTWNVMISGLTKWGEIELARSLFNQMPNRNVVSWTAVIDGYTRINQHQEAMELFQGMVVREGIKPTEVTLLTIIPTISNLGAIKICQSLHAYSEKCGFNQSDIRVANSLIDSYAKCGCINSASKFFNDISSNRKNLVSWTSIISGLAMHGMSKEAMERFQAMEKLDIEPNRVTFLSILNACSHGGLVEEGLKLFQKMVNGCGIRPDIKHYGCLIDMLGRAGRLEEAEKMALEIPIEIVNVVVWRTLLGSCSFHGNVEMGERVTRRIMEMECRYGGDYVLLSNIFSGAGRYTDAERVRSLMDGRNAYKVPGHSLV